MQIPKIWPFLAPWLLLLFLSFSVPRTSSDATSASNASDLAGALSRKHAYLFEDHTRAQLDALNRELREAEAERATEKSNAAMRRFVALLEANPNLIQVDLTREVPTVSPNKPILLPGNIGALLVRVISGEGGTYFSLLEYPMAVTEKTGPITIDNKLRGTTWVLISLSDIPATRSSLLLELQDKHSNPIRLPVEVRTPEPARLLIRILSSESPDPTPAMVRLVWTDGQIAYKPSTAVEFSGQFEGQGNTSSYRPMYIPGGRLEREYWCVAGPFDMTLQPGKWEIAVRRGLEHIPITDTLILEAGQTLAKTYAPRRWVDMPQRGWYSGDDHVHFRILSDDDARRLMTWVRAEDVHMANVVEMGDTARTYFQQRGFGKEHRVVEGHYVLSPGQEDPRTHGQSPDYDIGALGHVLAMNITGRVRDTSKYYLYDQIFDAVRDQGGLVGYAHVGAKSNHVHRDMSINVPKDKIDFVEVLQNGHLGTELYYEFLNLGFKLTASAGSDVPFAGTVGEVRVYAYLGGQAFSADAWFEAVRLGRTFVSNGPMIEFTVDGQLPGSEIRVKENRQLQVNVKAWGDPERLSPTRLEIVRHGEVIRQVESTPGDKQLSVVFKLNAEDGFWLAARAEASDGSRAHTTPIYVIREPLRFWKYEQVESLIVKRLASLVEVEEMVAAAQRLNQQGLGVDSRARIFQVQGFFEVQSLALQGSELLDRIAAAKEIYKQLREVLRDEESHRTSRNVKRGDER